MTRFARARGSKASNERAPEDSTPWDVMKEQLLQAKKNSEEAKNREEVEQQRIANYENFLKEQKVQKRKAEWCDFPEAQNGSSNLNKKKKKQKLNKQETSIEKPQFNEKVVNEITISQAPSGKNKKKQKPANEINQDQKLESTQDESTEINQSKKKKKKSKKTSETLPATENDQSQNAESKSQKKKQEGNKNKKSGKVSENVELGKSLPKHDQGQNGIPNQKQQPKKNKKRANSKPSRRKPIQERSFQLIINGKDVELVRYDGFPIMKKDADRLEELKNNMIKKGIPKSEVQRTMKLERRRAEKALARLKRDVCYNCRKGGHNLSDCPDLKTKIPGVGAADGMCFKCGSTEHRQFECKVQKDKEFRFATCFICKEPGHIARQCPDNPKGLYPNGGSCKLCGDVTHLRKDCPTVHDQKEEKSIKLQTLDSEENLEGIELKSNNTFSGLQTKKPKKIKF